MQTKLIRVICSENQGAVDFRVDDLVNIFPFEGICISEIDTS